MLTALAILAALAFLFLVVPTIWAAIIIVVAPKIRRWLDSLFYDPEDGFGT